MLNVATASLGSLADGTCIESTKAFHIPSTTSWPGEEISSYFWIVVCFVLDLLEEIPSFAQVYMPWVKLAGTSRSSQ